MSRPASPWYRASNDSWYFQNNGKQIFLCKGKANRTEAYKRFLEFDQAAPEIASARCSCKKVVALFLTHSRDNMKASTANVYTWFLEEFGRKHQKLDANKLQPKHVNEYLAAKTSWGKTTRHHAIATIKQAWKWANDEGYIAHNGISAMKKPRAQKRTEIMGEAETAKFLVHAKPELRDLLTFVWLTGCRPGEAAMIERRHVNLANAEIRFKIGEDKTSAKTGKPRVIHLNDAALALITRLYRDATSGTLFKNSRGNRWNKDTWSKAARRVRELTGLGLTAVAYSLRHQWATDALARGVPLATVAEMMGNSPEIVASTYSHLSDKKSLLMHAANLVRPTQG